MPDPNVTPDPTAAAAAAAAAVTAAAAAAGTPWFNGKVESETIGYWQNKGYDVNDPVAVANGLTKAYREAESKLGVPSAQLIRVPVDPTKDHDGMKVVFQRLGMPLDPKDYDFPALKGADGKVANTALESALRTVANEAFLPKDAAAKVAAAVVKYNTDTQTALEAEYAATLLKEKETIKTNWGVNEAANRVVAQRGAELLGLTREDLSALEKVAGYARVMEGLRNVGAKNGEDTFIRQPGGGADKIASVDQAKARVAELKADTAWVARYLAGDATAKREMGDLMVIISSGQSETR